MNFKVGDIVRNNEYYDITFKILSVTENNYVIEVITKNKLSVHFNIGDKMTFDIYSLNKSMHNTGILSNQFETFYDENYS
jgi:hypothetical protein